MKATTPALRYEPTEDFYVLEKAKGIVWGVCCDFLNNHFNLPKYPKRLWLHVSNRPSRHAVRVQVKECEHTNFFFWTTDHVGGEWEAMLRAAGSWLKKHGVPDKHSTIYVSVSYSE